jgi:multiple sugar transport system substrate-binding protein
MIKLARRWGVLAVATTAAVVLSGCAGGTGASSSGDGGEVTEIRLVAAEYSKNSEAFWEKFAQTYEDKTGIKLNVQVISWNDIDQQTSTMIQNNNAPDILNLNAYSSYAADGLLYTGDEVLSDSVKADLLPNFVANGTYDGDFYGIPDLSSARALFYNKDLFAQAGIDAPPTTWDEFVSAAEKLTALGNGVVGYAEPLGPEEAQAEFSMWMFNNGGDWKVDGEWAINSDENVETLQFLKDLATKYQVTQNNPGKTNRTDGAFSLFQSGLAGMVIGFSPLAATLDEAGDVNYATAPMPTSDGSEPSTLGVVDYLLPFKKPGNEDALRAFYDLYYQPDQVNTFIEQEGFLPVTASGLDVFSENASLATYLETLPNAKLVPSDDPQWDPVRLAVQQQIGTAVGPDGDPRAVLDKLQQVAVGGN